MLTNTLPSPVSLSNRESTGQRESDNPSSGYG